MADERDDDPTLESMRGVWLSMREEDPPSSGLDALMAAAKSQAAIMAKPTLWQRISTTLKRPPVLAFASVAILVGGIAIAMRHSDTAIEKAPASPPAMSTPAAPAAVTDGLHTAPPTDLPQQRKEETVAKPRPPAHVAKKADVMQKPAHDGAVSGKAAAESPNDELEDQLAAQARSAATRGDCQEARSIGARIARRDAAYYRDHVASDLAPCVANAVDAP